MTTPEISCAQPAHRHTPGPWSVDLCDHGAFAVYVPPRVDMGWSLVITSRNQHDELADEMHANARLIAAAPELLEALCALVLNVDAGGATLGALADARAVIAKATGAQA